MMEFFYPLPLISGYIPPSSTQEDGHPAQNLGYKLRRHHLRILLNNLFYLLTILYVLNGLRLYVHHPGPCDSRDEVINKSK